MIRGKKVILQVPDKKHLELMLQWRNNPDFRQYYREYRVLNKNQQLKWWKRRVIKDDSWQYFVVSPASEKDKIIGFVGLTYIHPIYKTAEYRGKGYGSDALRTVIKYGFEQLNLNRIWCEVYSNNKSVDVYRYLGFKDEGVLRQSVFKNGEYLDSYILSMLKEEYMNLMDKDLWDNDS